MAQAFRIFDLVPDGATADGDVHFERLAKVCQVDLAEFRAQFDIFAAEVRREAAMDSKCSVRDAWVRAARRPASVRSRQ